MLFGIGTSVQISISLGQKDYSKAEKALGNGFFMMILVSVFITVLIVAIKVPF
jgi:Na+-driven multidrug efflux pump